MNKRKMIAVGCLILSVAFLVSCVRKEAGIRGPSAIGIEGPEWRLTELSGVPVLPMTGNKQPFIMFDSIGKKASGFTGCNNFFCGYERDGASLKFGPVGSTRRACPEPEMGLESEFFKVLDKTRRWEIRDDVLLLLDGGDALARFGMEQYNKPAPDLESMTYLSTWLPSGKVRLSQGEYREPAAPGSPAETVVKLSDKKVFGTIQGKEAGAVVLVTDAAGSGTFYDLAFLLKGSEGWVNTDAILLGDRVKVHSVEIENNEIIITMTTHGPDDPMCCPTIEARKSFAVDGNRLVPLAEKNTGGEPQITGTVWQWVQTLYNDGRRAAPERPENYTIQFQQNGGVNAKADCNLKGGTYSMEGKRLSIKIINSTMAACPEGSLEDEFVRALSAAAVCFLKDGDLYIDLKYDTGTMKFSGRKGETR